jgi:mono/diheme cytochrome c family protein
MEAHIHVRRAGALVLLVLGAGVLLSGCSSKPAADTPSLTPPFLETQIAPRPATTAGTVTKGKQVYDANCVQCHGAEGKGDGYGAPFLVPSPRDFTSAQFKFRTTASGLLPTDDDLFRTISRGADGTGMPPWKYLLSDEDRWALVDYVKTFDPRFAAARNLAPMPLPDPPSKTHGADRGRDVYAKMQCAKCHGDDGRGVGPSTPTLVDAKGRYVNTRISPSPGSFRTGWTEREIIRTLETGMNGVPMPSYSGSCRSRMSTTWSPTCCRSRSTVAATRSGSWRRHGRHRRPDRVIQLREHAWKYEPSEIHVKRGEVVQDRVLGDRQRPRRRPRLRARRLDQSVFINGAMVGAPLSVTFKVDTPDATTSTARRSAARRSCIRTCTAC